MFSLFISSTYLFNSFESKSEFTDRAGVPEVIKRDQDALICMIIH